MKQFELTCCSTADLSKEYLERRGIPYVCFHFNIDGISYADDLGESYPIKQFYEDMHRGAMPVTSQVNVTEFQSFFEPLLKEGKDILHITLSSGISGTYNSACVARDELMEQYPDRRIVIVDSLGASSGYGLLVDAAADLRDKGMALQEAAAWAEGRRLNVHHWFFSTDLTAFKRGGRISATSAILGTVLNICPLMNIDFEGRLIPRFKIRTKKKAITEAVKKMEEFAEQGLEYSGRCFISHSSCPEDAGLVAKLVEERFPKLDGPVAIYDIGTVIGAHTGPGTAALFFFGETRKD